MEGRKGGMVGEKEGGRWGEGCRAPDWLLKHKIRRWV